MRRGKHCTPEERKHIQGLFRENVPIKTICKAFGRSRTIVDNAIRSEATGKSTGRPRKTTADVDAQIAEAYQGIEQAAENLGLTITQAKTKLMVTTSASLPINNQNLRRRDVQIDERTFEVVPEFTYLGSKVSNDNSMEAELRARMLAANRSFYSLKSQFNSKNLSRRSKLGIYSTYIVPVLTYASETWTLSKYDETLLAAFERKMLKDSWPRMCGRTMEDDELYEMYDDLTVVQRIKLARLRWAGHVVRMETDDPARKVFLGRPQGGHGRPKLRWQDGKRPNASAGITDHERFRALLRQVKSAKRL